MNRKQRRAWAKKQAKELFAGAAARTLDKLAERGSLAGEPRGLGLANTRHTYPGDSQHAGVVDMALRFVSPSNRREHGTAHDPRAH